MILNKRDLALAIAAKAHDGAVDRGGAPYIFHPMRVADAASKNKPAGMYDTRYVVGVLHDVVEDTDVKPADIAGALNLAMDDPIMVALNALTKKKYESYGEFIERCKANDLARIVKIADLEDNMNLDRIPKPKDEDYKRNEKYELALLYLKDGLKA